MSVYVRFARKPNLWAVAQQSMETLDSNDFPYVLLAELYDPDGTGVSFWEVESIDDPLVPRLVAAWAANPNGGILKKEHLVSVKTDFVEQLDLKINRTPSKLPDSEVSDLHRDVRGITGPKAVQLIKEMCDSDDKEFKVTEVGKYLVKSLQEGHLPTNILDGKLVSLLFTQRVIKLEGINL